MKKIIIEGLALWASYAVSAQIDTASIEQVHKAIIQRLQIVRF